jgi:hypothetical protein
MSTWSSCLRLVSVACVLAVVACGKDPMAISLKVGVAQIEIANPAGDRHTLAMAADGVVTLDGNRLFKVGGNGRIQVYPKLSFQLIRDDSMLVNGQSTNVAIRKNATFVLDGADQLSITSAGDVSGLLIGDIDHEVVKADAKLTYTGSAEVRRAMMFALAVVLTRGPQLPPPPEK